MQSVKKTKKKLASKIFTKNNGPTKKEESPKNSAENKLSRSEYKRANEQKRRGKISEIIVKIGDELPQNLIKNNEFQRSQFDILNLAFDYILELKHEVSELMQQSVNKIHELRTLQMELEDLKQMCKEYKALLDSAGIDEAVCSKLSSTTNDQVSIQANTSCNGKEEVVGLLIPKDMFASKSLSSGSVTPSVNSKLKSPVDLTHSASAAKPCTTSESGITTTAPSDSSSLSSGAILTAAQNSNIPIVICPPPGGVVNNYYVFNQVDSKPRKRPLACIAPKPIFLPKKTKTVTVNIDRESPPMPSSDEILVVASNLVNGASSSAPSDAIQQKPSPVHSANEQIAASKTPTNVSSSNSLPSVVRTLPLGSGNPVVPVVQNQSNPSVRLRVENLLGTSDKESHVSDMNPMLSPLLLNCSPEKSNTIEAISRSSTHQNQSQLPETSTKIAEPVTKLVQSPKQGTFQSVVELFSTASVTSISLVSTSVSKDTVASCAGDTCSSMSINMADHSAGYSSSPAVRSSQTVRTRPSLQHPSHSTTKHSSWTDYLPTFQPVNHIQQPVKTAKTISSDVISQTGKLSTQNSATGHSASQNKFSVEFLRNEKKVCSQSQHSPNTTVIPIAGTAAATTVSTSPAVRNLSRNSTVVAFPEKLQVASAKLASGYQADLCQKVSSAQHIPSLSKTMDSSNTTAIFAKPKTSTSIGSRNHSFQNRADTSHKQANTQLTKSSREKQTLHHFPAQKQQPPSSHFYSSQGNYFTNTPLVPTEDQRETVNLSNSIFESNSVDYWNNGSYPSCPVVTHSGSTGYTPGAWYHQQQGYSYGSSNSRFWSAPHPFGSTDSSTMYPVYHQFNPDLGQPAVGSSGARYGPYDQDSSAGFSFQLKSASAASQNSSQSGPRKMQQPNPSGPTHTQTSNQSGSGTFHIANMLPEVSTVSGSGRRPTTNQAGSVSTSQTVNRARNEPLTFQGICPPNYTGQDFAPQMSWPLASAVPLTPEKNASQHMNANYSQFSSRSSLVPPPAYDSNELRAELHKSGNSIAGFMPNFNF